MTSDSEHVVVDTNVIVYMIADAPLAGQFESHLIGRLGIVSFQSVAELLLIARRRDWGARRRQNLDDQLRRMVIVTATNQIIERWADLM